MKKKNYKIKIKKNYIITEAGEADLFSQEFQELGKAIADEGKMIFTTAQRLGNIYKNTVKSLYFLYKGDDETFAEVQREFLADQQKYKTEQDALLKAQPGFADLQKFLGMTSPGILLFDKFCGIDKADMVAKLERMRDRKRARARRNESVASYLNFIYYLCYYLDNSFNIKKHSISEDNQSKGTFKIDLVSSAVSISKTKNFKKALALLINKDMNINKGYKYKSDFSVSAKARQILTMAYRDASGRHSDIKKILKQNYSAQSTFSMLAENFKNESWRELFDEDFRNFDFDESNPELKENYSSKKSVLKITKNNLLIKEAEEDTGEEETKEPESAEVPGEEEIEEEKSLLEQLTDNKTPAKKVALLSNITYSYKRFELASLFFTNIFSRMYQYTNAKKNHFENLSENAKIDDNDFEKNMSNLIKEISTINEKVESYNKLFKSNITQLNKKASEDIKKEYADGESKINEEINNNEKIAEKSFSKSDNLPEITKATRFVTALSIVAEIIKDGGLVKALKDGTNNVEKYIEFYKSIATEDKEFIVNDVPKAKTNKGSLNAKQLLEQNLEVLTKSGVDLDPNDIDNIDSLYDKTIKSYNDLISLNSEFNKFTSKESDLQSKIDSNLKVIPDEVDEVISDSDDSDQQDKEQKSSSDFTEITYVKKEESEK